MLMVYPSTVRAVEKSFNTGAIVGGVLGGIGFIILGALAFLYYRRLRNRKETKEIMEVDDHAQYVPRPFYLLPVNHAHAPDSSAQNSMSHAPGSEDLSMQVREREQQMVALQGQQSTPSNSIAGRSGASDSVSLQVEELRREVEQLREQLRQMMSGVPLDFHGGAPPPMYN